MRKNLAVLALILALLSGSAAAMDVETSATPDASGTTEELNVTSANATTLEALRTNTSNITRRYVSAVPGVDGRIIREPALVETDNTTAPAEAQIDRSGAVPGVSGPIVAEPATLAATTEPPLQTPVPLSPAPLEGKKPACGPTSLILLALAPLALKRAI